MQNTDIYHSHSAVIEGKKILQSLGVGKADVGIVLGTGLGSVAKKLSGKISIPFDDCPYFPKATSIGHSGQLVYGTLAKKKVLIMEGRFHFYEGYSLQQIAYPVYVMKALGIKKLIITNAAGGLNPLYSEGDLVVVEDHINLMGDSPLVGFNDEKLGPRFPDMIEPYNHSLKDLCLTVGAEEKIKLQRGVYVGVKGPQLETRAEYRFLRQIGADVVGMSTIPEVLAAVHCGVKTLAISCVTDLCLPDALKPVDIPHILSVAGKTEPKLTHLISKVVAKL